MNARDLAAVQPMDQTNWFQQFGASKKGWRLMARARVDDQPWYKVFVFDPEIYRWVLQQDPQDWSVVVDDRTVDFSERLYTVFLMRWS